jgi:hypothetical protein
MKKQPAGELCAKDADFPCYLVFSWARLQSRASNKCRSTAMNRKRQEMKQERNFL